MALQSCRLTKSVNDQEHLMPGTVCAAMLELTVIEAGALQLKAGDRLVLRRRAADGTPVQEGVFIAQKPSRSGAICKLKAFDLLQLLDRDLSLWFAALDRWPYTLQELLQMVCDACTLPLLPTEFPNAQLPVQRFSAQGVTGRQLVQWIAQAAGRFCTATADGQAKLAWYTPASLDVGLQPVAAARAKCLRRRLYLEVPQGEVSLTDGMLKVQSPHLQLTAGQPAVLHLSPDLLQQYCLQGAMELQPPTAPVTRVQLCQTETDVGTVYPADAPAGVTMRIVGNPLLAASDAQSLTAVAEQLYRQFAGLSYTPAVLKLPATPQIDVGQTFLLYDGVNNGQAVYIMELTRGAEADTVRCNGAADRQVCEAVNSRSAVGLAGKMLQLRTDVDGLLAENSDNAGKYARLEMDIAGIRTKVSAQEASAEGLKEQLTGLEQTAKGLSLSVQRICDDGVQKLQTSTGYTFDEQGLRITRSGEQMENLLDNTGMYVRRSGQTILQANDAGVTAVDVRVKNFLIIGTHSRFEDYGAGRTACFYLEG